MGDLGEGTPTYQLVLERDDGSRRRRRVQKRDPRGSDRPASVYLSPLSPEFDS